MNCPPTQHLQRLLDRSLPADEESTVRAHLDVCSVCKQTLDRLSSGDVTWMKAPVNMPDAARLDCALDDPVEPSLPSWQDDLAFLQPSDRPGSLGRLDKYEVLSSVGKGGFGIVLKAIDETLNRVVAIKVMSPYLASSDTARRRFAREAKAAAAVTHENVVTIYEVRSDVKIPYLVMPFVNGQTLDEKMDRHGACSVNEIARIGRQIAAGLAAAHRQGLIHRDIKPGNILLETETEQVKITDFGLARAADDASVTRPGTIIGTPMYMSPEQASGEPVDHRSDLFSLGSVMYAMAAGRPPFRAANTMAVMKGVCDETPAPVQQRNEDIPDWLAGLIAKLHAKKPADRFQSAQEVAELLGEQLACMQATKSTLIRKENANTVIPPDGVAPAVERSRTRRVVVLGLLTCLAALLYATFHFRDPPEVRAPVVVPKKIEEAPPRQLSVAELLTSPDYEWSTPESLGPAINAGTRNLGASLTADERIMIFARNMKLWISRRSSVLEPFTQAELLPKSISDQAGELATISGDGLLLAFNSTGGKKESIYVSTRKTVDEPFGEPVRLSDPVNRAVYQRAPILSSDGLTLLVTTSRKGGRGGGDIVMFTRKTRSDAFDDETMLPESVNTPVFDVPDWLSADERVLLTTTMGVPPFKTHLHVRPSRDAPFGPPLPLGPPFETVQAGRPWLSPDGKRMYFHTRDLPGNNGQLDLWMTRRVPKGKAAL